MAHPVNKDDPADLGSVNVKGSPDLKWKPKSEKHDHLKTHVQHGNGKSTTVVYQKITVTSDSKDVSKDKPDENGHEESTKTEHPTEFSSKHDTTHKHKDLKKHEDESTVNEKKPKIKTSKYKDKNWNPYPKFEEKQQIKPTDHKYVKPQRENRVKESASPIVDDDSIVRVGKPYDNVFAEGRRREEQEKLKNKLSKNDKREADKDGKHKDGKPRSPDDDSAIQPEFNVSDVTKEQWQKLTEDEASMKALDKAKKAYNKLLKQDKEEAEKQFKEFLRQALAQSEKKAQEREKLNKGNNKPSKPNKYSKYIDAFMEEKPRKPHKAKGVEKKKTIGKRCFVPWWVYLVVELKQQEMLMKEKKKFEEKLGQFLTPPATESIPSSHNKTKFAPGLNDKKQDSDAKLQTKNKESKQKPAAQTNTASERPKPTPANSWPSFVNNHKAKEPISSQLNSTQLKEALTKKKDQDKIDIAPGKTKHVDKAKLSIETEETNEKTKESVKTYKTPHQGKDKDINKDPKAEIQKDLNKNPLTARIWPPIPPRRIRIPLSRAQKRKIRLEKLKKKYPGLAHKIMFIEALMATEDAKKAKKAKAQGLKQDWRDIDYIGALTCKKQRLEEKKKKDSSISQV